MLISQRSIFTLFRTQQQQAGGGDLTSGPSGFYGDLDDIGFGGNHSCSQTVSSGSCSTGNSEIYPTYLISSKFVR